MQSAGCLCRLGKPPSSGSSLWLSLVLSSRPPCRPRRKTGLLPSLLPSCPVFSFFLLLLLRAFIIPVLTGSLKHHRWLSFFLFCLASHRAPDSILSALDPRCHSLSSTFALSHLDASKLFLVRVTQNSLTYSFSGYFSRLEVFLLLFCFYLTTVSNSSFQNTFQPRLHVSIFQWWLGFSMCQSRRLEDICLPVFTCRRAACWPQAYESNPFHSITGLQTCTLRGGSPCFSGNLGSPAMPPTAALGSFFSFSGI